MVVANAEDVLPVVTAVVPNREVVEKAARTNARDASRRNVEIIIPMEAIVIIVIQLVTLFLLLLLWWVVLWMSIVFFFKSRKSCTIVVFNSIWDVSFCSVHFAWLIWKGKIWFLQVLDSLGLLHIYLFFPYFFQLLTPLFFCYCSLSELWRLRQRWANVLTLTHITFFGTKKKWVAQPIKLSQCKKGERNVSCL